MKKLLLFAFAGLTIFSACKKDDDEVSRLEINQGKTTITGNTINMIVWDKCSLIVKPFPENTTPEIYIWSSSNPDIVSLELSGPKLKNCCKVTALKDGETDITVSTENGINASCHIVISEVEITKIELNNNDVELLIGENKELTAKVTPDNASFKDLSYISSDKSVAKVGANGIIEALKPGECQIKVSNHDGKITAICNVKVIPNEVTNLILNQNKLNIEQGDTYKFETTIEPTIATDKTVTWVSSDENIAKIDADGTLTAVNVGECTITATSSNVEVKDECSVKVIPVSVKGLELNKTSSKILIGSNETLTATILPSNANNKKVSWGTSNATVAIVDNGVVTGLSAGNATITVTAEDGGFIQTCEITVGGMEMFMLAENGSITTTFTNAGVFSSCKCELSNNSNVDVYIKNVAIDGSTLPVEQSLGSYQKYSTTIYTNTANNVVWTIEYNGVEYSVYSTFNSTIGLNDLFGW